MRWLRRMFSRPSIQSLVYLFAVFIGYLWLVNPREVVLDVELVGNLAYLASGPKGIQILDVSDVTTPRLIGSYQIRGSAKRIAVQERYAFVAAGRSGLIILDVGDPNRVHLISSYDTPGSAEDVALSGDFAFVADGRSGLQVVNISKPERPQKPQNASVFDPGGRSMRILINDKIGYLADSNRALTILDVSNPRQLEQLGVFGARSNILGITLAGPFAYLAEGEAGLQIVNRENPAQLVEAGFFDTSGEARAISVSGDYAYVADGRAGVRIIEVHDPQKMAEVGAYESVQNAMDLEFSDHRIYLADGYEGLRILDQGLHFSFNMLSPANQPGNVEDVAVDQAYAFLASESQGVRVLDIRNAQTPREIGIFDTPGQAVAVTRQGDFLYVADRDGGLRILYNAGSTDGALELAERAQLSFPGEALDVAVNGAFGYVAAGNSGLRVVNLEDPGAPREIGAEERVAQSLGVYVEGDFAYVASGASGLHIVNVFDRTKPALISSLDTPGDARAVAVTAAVSGTARAYALVADGDAGLRILDVTDPYAPREVGTNDAPEYAYDVAVSGNLAFVTGRNDGLWVMDISNPAQPREIGFYDTPGEAQGLKLLGNNAFVAAHERGLRIIEVADPTAPREIGFFDVPRLVTDVVVREDAYLIDEGRGLRVMNVEDPKDPREIGFYDTPGLAKGLDVQDNHAYLGTDANLKIVDISNPVAPRETGSFGTPAPVVAVTIEGQYAYVANGLGGLRIVNVSDPAHPASAGTFDTPGTAFDVAVSGSYAYIADGGAGLSIANVSDPNRPQIASLLTGYTDARSVLAVGNYAYLANGVDGVYVLDVSKPAAPTEVTHFDTPGIAQNLAAAGDFLFVADGEEGVQVVYILNPANPVRAGEHQPPGKSVAIDVVPRYVREGDPRHFYIYAASNELGLQIIDASQEMTPLDLGLFSTAGLYPLRRTLEDAWSYGVRILTRRGALIPDKFWVSVQAYLFDALVFGISVAFFVAFVAQYILPVEKNRQRLKAIGKLFGYLLGSQGAGVVIREGKVQSGSGDGAAAAAEDLRQFAPGVILLDANSAAILRKTSGHKGFWGATLRRRLSSLARRFGVEVSGGQPETPPPAVRTEGPGLVFTGPSGSAGSSRFQESIWGVADLRTQVRAYPDVRGFTRDGIEVKTNVYIVFTIGDSPQVLEVGYDGAEKAENLRVIFTRERIERDPNAENHLRKRITIRALQDELDPDDKDEIHRYVQSVNPAQLAPEPEPGPKPVPGQIFQVDSQRVFAAVFSNARSVPDEKTLDWTVLPVQTAVEAFRNLLIQEVYEALFRPTDPEEYTLSVMRRNFLLKMRNQGVLSFRFVRRKDNQSLAEGQQWDPVQLTIYPTRELHQPKVLRTRGIKVIVAGFSELQAVSEKVKERLVDRWSAAWERDAMVTTAEYELHAERIRNKARAQAQGEMVLALAQILEGQPISQEAAALRLFQALETVAADPKTRQLLPAETIAMLRSLREWLLPGGGERPFEGLPPPGTVPPAPKEPSGGG